MRTPSSTPWSMTPTRRHCWWTKGRSELELTTRRRFLPTFHQVGPLQLSPGPLRLFLSASESREEPSHLATKVWEPNKMPDHKVEQFLVVARSIGTFARALLDGAKKPQISLRLGAAAASRDITLVSLKQQSWRTLSPPFPVPRHGHTPPE